MNFEARRIYTLEGQYGSMLELGTKFWRIQPESPSPMGEPDIELVRRHSEDEIESTGDGLPKPELWAWQGKVLGRTPDELAANKRLLNEVVERCRKITRGDGAVINVSKGSRPQYTEDEDNPYLSHAVTFLLAPRLPYWLEPDTRTWETFFAFPFPYPDEFIRSY
jgi:hypothetical protein